jgi:hypothetical protein
VDRRLGGPQNRSGRGDEDKYSQPLPGIENPIIQPVAQRYTAELSWLYQHKMVKTKRHIFVSTTKKYHGQRLMYIFL